MKLRRLAFILSFALSLAAHASASTVYTFTNANEPELGSGPWGTITTSLVDGTDIDLLLNEILVQVDLTDGFILHGKAFGFNVDPEVASITSISSPFFVVGGTNENLDGYGNFDFTIDGPDTSTARSNNLDTLSFIVGRPAGFTADTQLEVLSEGGGAGWYFAAQIAALDESLKTGFTASKLRNSLDDEPPTPRDIPVPEPASLLLLGTGLVGIAARARKRLRR